ncbi:hypothetical protein, partial [Arsenophonus nasoniae]|uniref:hypothetical protein n=1 Tax=Arsenophonus nasoniae TaxID=638 RepID=UPI001B7FB793
NTINRSPSPFCNKGWLLLLTLKAIQFPNHEPDNEVSPQLPQEDKLKKVDDNKDVIFESIRLHDEEKMPDIQLEEEPSKLEKENDEINISYHHEEEKKQKIKEKEYRD